MEESEHGHLFWCLLRDNWVNQHRLIPISLYPNFICLRCSLVEPFKLSAYNERIFPLLVAKPFQPVLVKIFEFLF